MDIDVIKFDQFRNHDVEKIKLTNDHSVSISILTMGAILNEFLIPTSTGTKNIILNFNHTSDYYQNPFYIGMAIGRTGGRIKNGTMPLNGKNVHLPSSEGTTTHHGGPHGFSDHFWQYRLAQKADYVATTLYRRILSTEDGYPGNLDVEITFKLNNDNEVEITYQGQADQDTFFNPTCHAYFNLSESSSILNHTLTVASDEYLEVDQNKIPTGKFLATSKTAFDFSHPRLLEDSIHELRDTTEKGLDDIFKLNTTGKIAELQDSDSKDRIEIYSNRNGLVAYTANTLEGFQLSRGEAVPYMGIALEAQTLPDTHNHEGFGDVTLPAGQKTSRSITYKYIGHNL